MLEPQKTVFKRLKNNHVNSENLSFENVALGAQAGSSSLFKVNEDLVDQYNDLGGVASFDRKHVLREILSNKKRLTFSDGRSADSYIQEEVVQVVTYSCLISKYNLTSLDILMIDAEGYDFEAVSLFPYDILLPKAIVFEYKHLSRRQLKDLKLLLQSYGYISFFSKNDALFILESNG
jgi:FkbM family methyltransferase